MNFDDNNEITHTQLRLYLYQRAFSENYDRAVEAHAKTCEHCQQWIRIMVVTDEVLTGEDDKRVKASIRVIECN